MPWDATPGGGFTTGTPWFPFAPGRETANVASQKADPASLLSRYRDLIRVRKASAALARGELELLTPTSGISPFLAFLRRADGERVLVVHNLSDAFQSAGPFAVDGTTFERLWADAGSADPSGAPGSLRVFLPGRGTGVWRVR